MTFERTFDVPARPDIVFAYLTEPERASVWQGSLLEARLEPPAPMRQGTRIREVRRFLGRRVESTVEVTELERDRLFGGRVDARPLPWRFEYRLEEAGDRTLVHVRLEGEPRGLLRVGGGVVLRVVEQELARDFATLAELVRTEK